MVLIPEVGMQHMPEEIWLNFNGTARQLAGGYRLYPKDIEGVTIDHKSADIAYSGVPGSLIQIRLGAIALRIRVAEDSSFNSATVSTNSHPSCRGGSTRCFNGVEYCCEGNKVVGNCLGVYRCPVPETK